MDGGTAPPLSPHELDMHSEEYSRDGVMPIAVVGMGCRFPGGASSPSKFWEMMANGRSGWSPVPASRFTESSFYHPSSEFNSSGGHFLDEDISLFDAPFFSISPQEAKAMDPQMRLQLEVAYEALENAGITMEQVAGTKTGVYIAVFSEDYSNIMLSDPESLPLHHVTGTGKAIFANRLSYYLDLKGPSFTLDTGCSGSLVALHQACQSLRSGESEQAIVGGTNLLLSPKTTISLSRYGFLSDEGRCYSFDSRGSGYGRGEGVASIMIKPLRDALAAGDPIRAVIRNTVVNQDGKSAGMTMPSFEAQASMMRSAYAEARLDPCHTNYIEAHGTGTKAGDPIEAGAVAAVFASARDASDPLLIGSVKTNIGHLESASGLAGLIKGVLCLENGIIPPSINYLEQNEDANLAQAHLKVPTDLESLLPKGLGRISVNSFGYGGTNAHVILDSHSHNNGFPSPGEQQARSAIACVKGFISADTSVEMDLVSTRSDRKCVFLLTHRTKLGVLSLFQALRGCIEGRNRVSDNEYLDDLAHTLGSHRTRFGWRLALIAASREELLGALTQQKREPRRVLNEPRVGFIFTGQGAQWHAMGIELVDQFEVFKNTLLIADAHFKSLGAAWSLIDELERPAMQSRVNSAAIGQPLCTALQIALVDLLREWNVRPVSVTGHSSGEIAAAYACGAITLQAALTIAYYRGHLASTMLEKGQLRGAMMAVGLSEAETRSLIAQIPKSRGRALVACVNSPRSVTVSGDRTAILALQSILEARQVFVRRLAVNTAYHSHHMEVVAHSYLSELQKIPIIKSNGSTSVKFYSSVTGCLVNGNDLDSDYWVRNMVSQVRFSDSFQNLCKGSNASGEASASTGSRWAKPAVDVILELGPHSGLAGFVKQNLAALQQTKIEYITCLVRDKDATQTMLSAASSLVECGCPVSLKPINFNGNWRHPQVCVDIPSYPWDHSVAHWHESRFSLDYRKRSAPRHPLLGAPSSDFNALEPTWRGIIRASEIPWIRGHVIQSNIVYPAAGYVSMAIEASLQRHQLKGLGHAIHMYKLRDISINNMLLIPDDTVGVETVFSLRPYNRSARTSSDDWDEFRVFSYADGGRWTEHCRGLVSVQYHNAYSEVEGSREIELKLADHRNRLETTRAQCQNFVDSQILYDKLHAVGLEFQDCFRCIKSAQSSEHLSLGDICIPDTASFMPKQVQLPHVLHPATLDACMQMTSVSLVNSGTLIAPMVPTFIKEILVSNDVPKEPGVELLVETTTTNAGKRSSTSSFTATLSTPTLTQLPSIEVHGFSCTAVGVGAPSTTAFDRKICHKLQWSPLKNEREDEGHHTSQVQIAAVQEVVTNGTTVASYPSIVLIQPQDPTLFLQNVVSELSKHLAASLVEVSVNAEDIATTGLDGKVCIFLNEMELPVLHACTESLWLSTQAMLSSASQVLWVTCGGAMDVSSPEAGLITGLARSSRSDNESLRLVTLDIDPNQSSPEKAGKVIIDVLDKSFSAATGQSVADDVEYVERKGQLSVPRLVEDPQLQQHLKASTTSSQLEVKVQPFFQADRILRLEVSAPGMLDSLQFVEEETALLPLVANELKMSPRAFGVNFRDVMISLGQLEETSQMSSEHSGIVTEVGTGLESQFAVGDRICAWGGKAYASSIRVTGMAAYKIPEDMSFESAASIPIVYATAYYALVHLARIREGESVLIHSAAGGVGQAAIMLAKYFGAVIFATVGNEEKKALLMNEYNISADHIFSSRKTKFVDGIKRLTGGNGVDVALNSIAGEGFHETCKCVAKMGRFIEIGKRDILANARLDMEMFNRNITFASVDLTIVFEHDPGLAQRMLAAVFQLLSIGAIKPVKPLNVFPLAEIEGAFRLIQSGKHLGKVVLKAEVDTQVKTLPRPATGATFAENSSYLIVGGLGGLGRVICHWMASKKCKHIVLVSRSGPESPGTQVLVDELGTLDVKLKVYACDVSNTEELERTLKACYEQMPPIRGVIQSAMVIKDSLINKMTLKDYQDVLRPKVQGTINLHQHLSARSLDFFILLSSCAGIIGNNGQANYASACTFQDAFARHCTRLGMPTRSLDLGMIEGAGYVSQNPDSLRFLTAQGFQSVKLPQLFAVLDYAISEPIHSIEDSQLIVGLTCPEQDELPPNLLDAKFTYLRASRNRGTQTTAPQQSLQASIQNASSTAEAQHIMTAAIIAQVSKVLVLPSEDIYPSKSITAYGGDSLSAVELRSWFSKTANAAIGVMEILSGKSIETLSQETLARSGFAAVEKEGASIEESEEIP